MTRSDGWGATIDAVAIPVLAILVALVLFGAFIALHGVDPFAAYGLMFQGAFGSAFSWQNSLLRSAPLILTALCTALPARAGLVVIGAEGALALGGLAAAAVGHMLDGAGGTVTITMMGIAAAIVGGAWVALAGALRYWRGVNETIASLLLVYIAIALFNHLVEGLLRDPASLNKPSTPPIADDAMIGSIPGLDVHWGLVAGLVLCLAFWVLIERTTTGFAIRLIGDNPKAARLAGLRLGGYILAVCGLGGAAAGLAGLYEVAAVHGQANASLLVGYGFTGILVSFLARHNPLAIIPVAILIGGIGASGGLLQRRLDLPDAAVLVLQGILFVTILASETMYGRIRWRLPRMFAERRAA